MVDMINHDILPAVSGYATDLCERADSKAAAGASNRYEVKTAKAISALTDTLADACEELEEDLSKVPSDAKAAMVYNHETIVPAMAKARAAADELETMTASEYWPFPTYKDILFYM